MMSPREGGLAEETITDDQGTAGCPTPSGVHSARRAITCSDGRTQPDLDTRSTLGPTADREGSAESVEAVNQAAQPGPVPTTAPPIPSSCTVARRFVSVLSISIVITDARECLIAFVSASDTA